MTAADDYWPEPELPTRDELTARGYFVEADPDFPGEFRNGRAGAVWGDSFRSADEAWLALQEDPQS